MRRALTLAAVLVAVTTANAQAETFPVIKDPMVLKECGACHMVFPPETLPKATWTKIIGDLSNHFGEDATLTADKVAHILDFHVKNASDVSGSKAAARWKTDAKVTRILDAPRFLAKHKNCADVVFQSKEVGSKSNCLACHPDMTKTGSAEASLRALPKALRAQCRE